MLEASKPRNGKGDDTMFPLTGNGKLDKDLAEEHERDLLEEVQAEEIAEGDEAALESENYQPVTDDDDDLIQTHKSNTHIKKGEK
jgi:hypothetical protein